MLQTGNVFKSNVTRPIGCRVLPVKCSKNDHLNLEECTRQLTTRPRLFKGWITLSTGQIAIQRIAWFVLLTLIRWIAIYPVDSVIQPLNNRGLNDGFNALRLCCSKLNPACLCYDSKPAKLHKAR